MESPAWFILVCLHTIVVCCCLLPTFVTKVGVPYPPKSKGHLHTYTFVTVPGYVPGYVPCSFAPPLLGGDGRGEMCAVPFTPVPHHTQCTKPVIPLMEISCACICRMPAFIRQHDSAVYVGISMYIACTMVYEYCSSTSMYT